MSALSEPTPSRSRSSSGGDRAGLRPVAPQVAPLRQLPFLLVLAGVLGLGMVGLLVLNTTVQNQSFELSDKRSTATRLGYVEAGLQHELDQVSSPRSLALKATALGMRPNAQPAFLVLPDGTVVGPQEAADGKDFPSAIVKSPAQLEAERRAAEQRKAEAEKKKAEAEKKKAEAEKKKAEEKKADEEQDGGE